jgi:hypothetical protein
MLEYVEYLTPNDIKLLEIVSQSTSRVLDSPVALQDALESNELYTLLFERKKEPLELASPFLVFLVLLNRVRQDLSFQPFVNEWVKPGVRIPVFDTKKLIEFTSKAHNRLSLAVLLDSYTKVSSGTVWLKSGRRWRKTRYSELDPIRLSSLLDFVTEGEQFIIYKRLGDLSLFLTGIFPDYVGSRILKNFEIRYLVRHFHHEDTVKLPDELTIHLKEDALSNPYELLSWIGQRSYLRAHEMAKARSLRAADDLYVLAEQFVNARRTLNVMTDKYLFVRRNTWFSISDN